MQTAHKLRPQLKLFQAAPGQDQARVASDDPLSTFGRDWFVPIALVGEGRHAGTVTSYRESLEWWARLTGDPPMSAIDEFCWAQFKTGLREAHWVRGKSGQTRPLASCTRTKHERQIHTLLLAARRRGFVAELSEARVGRPGRHLPKPSFALASVLEVAAATSRLPPPREVGQWTVPPDKWWFALVVLLFYTGLRLGTVLALGRSMLAYHDAESGRFPGWYIGVPGTIVEKTGKPLEKFLHPTAHAAIEALARPARKGIFLVKRTAGELALPHCRRYLIDRHEELQRLAGVPPAKILDFQGWRRTHGTELAKLGAQYARDVAQRTLDHHSARTTSTFYLDTDAVEAQLIARLPAIKLPTRQLDLF
jgi:integrase